LLGGRVMVVCSLHVLFQYWSDQYLDVVSVK
jgi:hypothetical protein